MSQSPSSPVQPAAHAKRPILVVDDEPEMLYSLKNLLRREYEVFTAASGEEGIKILQEHAIHVVMTDQRMPLMTGVELLHRMKSEHPAAMRLIFTGYADISAIIDAINQGNVFRYVTKPWDPDELLKALREAGDRYDQIINRNRLLADLRAYEAKCVDFGNGLLDGKCSMLPPEAAAVGMQLWTEARTLATRLDRALEATLTEPMC